MGKSFSIGNFYFFHYVQKTQKNFIASTILSTHSFTIAVFLALLTVNFPNGFLPTMTNGQGQKFFYQFNLISCIGRSTRQEIECSPIVSCPIHAKEYSSSWRGERPMWYQGLTNQFYVALRLIFSFAKWRPFDWYVKRYL